MTRTPLNITAQVTQATLCAALMGGVCAYQLRLSEASELEMSLVTAALNALLFLPTLRSKLMRRRLWVNTWLRREGRVSELLQGGALYGAITLLFCLPWATLIIAELVSLTSAHVALFMVSGALCLLIKLALERQLSKLFVEGAASVLAREWSVRLCALLCALALAPIILHQPRPDLAGRSLQEALLLMSADAPQVSGGLFGGLHQLVALKEVAFWWLLQNLTSLLEGLPPTLISVARVTLSLMYMLYALSVAYAFSRLQGAFVEFFDPQARLFLWRHTHKEP